MYHDTFCLVYCVCVSSVSESREGSELSFSFFYVFSPRPFPLCHLSVCVCACVCGKVCGRFHGTVPTLHSTPPPSIPFPLPHLYLFSLIYPSILFRPSVAASPLSLSITPAVMRLNLSVSTGHAHAHTLYTPTLQSAATHTHNHPLKREHTILSHMH